MHSTLHSKLDAYLADAKPFDWRANNCAHFAAGWVRIATGLDVLAAWDAVMPRTREALRLLQQAGGHARITDAVLQHRIGPMFAQVGDIVLLNLPTKRKYTGAAWGICTGSHVAALGHDGIMRVDLQTGSAAWRL